MKRQKLLIVVTILAFVGFCSCAKEEHTQEPTRRIRKLPDSFAFATASELADLPPYWRNVTHWPTQQQIKDQRVPLGGVSVERAVNDTMRWLSIVLRDKWVPDRSDVDILPLRASFVGYDAVWLRYECEGYAIQVTSTSSSIVVVIKDRNMDVRKGKIDRNQMRAYVSSIFDKFFRESEKIKSVSMNQVKAENGIIMGYPTIKGPTVGYWWGLVGWWTDGNTVRITADKADGGPWSPDRKTEWFSEKKEDKTGSR